jgi:branched-chain amino acid transport system substrate-binding protein
MIALLLTACSFTTTDVDACTTNLECREAFGWGSVCGDDGLCADWTPNPRCDRTIPADLFDNKDEYRDLVVLGSLYEREESLLDVMSFELAVTQVNDQGGLDGRPFGFVQCSNEENPEWDDLVAEEANVGLAVTLADEVGVPAIMGPSYSSRTQDAYRAIRDDYDTLMISPSATSPTLTELDDPATDAAPGKLWRTAPPDSIQARAIALALEDAGVSAVTIVYADDAAYGTGLAQELAGVFSGQSELRPFGNSSDRDDQTVQAGGDPSEYVMFVSSDKSDVTAFLNAAGSVAAYDTKEGIFLTDAAYDTNILDDARSASHLFPKIRGTRPATPVGGVYDFFLASFSAEYAGEDASGSAFPAYAYDASWLVIYGATWAHHQEDAITGTGVARGLRNVSQGPEIEVRGTSWTAVESAFARGDSIDVVGASGQLDFDPVTEETAGPIDLWTVQASGNDFDIVCTFDPVTASSLPAACTTIE